MPIATGAAPAGDPARHRLVAAAAGLLLLGLLWIMPDRDELGRPLVLTCLLGAAFGVVLQRSRFCFWCIFRDWLEHRDPSGLLGLLAALAVGLVGYSLLFGIWVPAPAPGRLPPDAHVGPVSLTLAAGAFAFGVGMALSGSCISAHLYRLGEGAYGSLVALAGAVGGFVLGFLTWNTLYLVDLHRAVVIWLPAHLGHGGALALQLGALALIAAALLRSRRTSPADPSPRSATATGGLLQRKWPAVTGGILIGWIALLAYLRSGPLGVTAELGSVARTLASTLDLLPEQLFGLDGLAGCATAVKSALWSRNGVFVAGLVLGSVAAARISGDYRATMPKVSELPRLFAGGLLLGWGAMVSLGCTVGVLLSGIMAGAASGWVFALFCLTGAYAGWLLRKRPRRN